MVVTEEWLRSNMNNGIGVTAKQIKALGLSYPPKKGWLRGIVGTEISEEQAIAFQNGRGIKTTVPEESDSVLVDSVVVCSYVVKMSKEELLKSPLLAYGYMKPLQGSCSLCAKKIRHILKTKGVAKVHYVPVCSDCALKLGIDFATDKPKVSEQKNPPVVDSNISFDNMRKLS